jgi:hypothetical protein
MAFGSFGILIMAIVVNLLREPLFGIKEGYAPHNFSFNFIFFLPSMLIALGLGLAVIGRTIKHWKTWTDLRRKWMLIGLSIPAIGLWSFLILRIILNE